MKLYHVTTPRKAKQYRQTGCILSPVRGFNNLTAAMAWAIKVNRTVILEVDADKPYKLPDHHNKFGEAWWNDGDVKTISAFILLKRYDMHVTEAMNFIDFDGFPHY